MQNKFLDFLNVEVSGFATKKLRFTAMSAGGQAAEVADYREPTDFAFQHRRLQLKAQYALGREAVALEEALSMCGEVLDAFTVMESMFARQKLRNAELVVQYARNLRVNIGRTSGFDSYSVDEQEDSLVALEEIVYNGNGDMDALARVVAGHLNQAAAYNMAREDASEHGRIAGVMLQEEIDLQEKLRVVRKPTTQERTLAKQTAFHRPNVKAIQSAKYRALKQALVDNRGDLARIFDGVVSASGGKPYFTVFVAACAEEYKADYEDICKPDPELEGGGPENVWTAYTCAQESWIGPFLARSGRHFRTYTSGHVPKALGELFQDYGRKHFWKWRHSKPDIKRIRAHLWDVQDQYDPPVAPVLIDGNDSLTELDMENDDLPLPPPSLEATDKRCCYYCRIGLASLAQEAFDHGFILAPLSDMNDEFMEVILSPFPFHMSM